MSDSSELYYEIQKQDPDHITKWDFLEVAGYGVLAAHLPLGLLLVVGSNVADSLAKRKKQSETPMPDEWLQQVSESDNVSPEGIEMLAKALKKRGFVSVKDAINWADHERRLAEKNAKEAALRKKDGSDENISGASMILARAKTELTDRIPVPQLQSAIGFVSKPFRSKSQE